MCHSSSASSTIRILELELALAVAVVVSGSGGGGNPREMCLKSIWVCVLFPPVGSSWAASGLGALRILSTGAAV